jgi:hypothetical protein
MTVHRLSASCVVFTLPAMSLDFFGTKGTALKCRRALPASRPTQEGCLEPTEFGVASKPHPISQNFADAISRHCDPKLLHIAPR